MKSLFVTMLAALICLEAKSQFISVTPDSNLPPSSSTFNISFPHSNYILVDSFFVTNNLLPKAYDCTFIYKECAPPANPRRHNIFISRPFYFPYGETRIFAHLWLDSNTVDSTCVLRVKTLINENDVLVWNFTNLAVPASVRNTFSIYPNPATSSITISPPQGTHLSSLAISDITGREVINATEPDKVNATSQTINISQLAPGTYFIKAKDENQLTVTKKFVKL